MCWVAVRHQGWLPAITFIALHARGLPSWSIRGCCYHTPGFTLQHCQHPACRQAAPTPAVAAVSCRQPIRHDPLRAAPGMSLIRRCTCINSVWGATGVYSGTKEGVDLGTRAAHFTVCAAVEAIIMKLAHRQS